MNTAGPVRWGILGPGNIARDFFAGAVGSTSGSIMVLGTRDVGQAGLREHFPSVRIVAGYDALIADPQIDAVYVALPHPFHARWAIAAARQGKHVLCEKPMSVSALEVEAMFVAARRAGTFMGEAYMYRFHPLAARIAELVRSNAIGEVRMIKSSFGFQMPKPNAKHRLFNPELGGGALLDLAGYLVSMAILIVECSGEVGLPMPDTVKAVAYFGKTGVDERTSALLYFPNGVIAELSCSISACQDNVLHLLGTNGRLEVDHFWFAGGKTGGSNTMRLIRPDGQRETLTVDEPRHLYRFQFEATNHAIRSGATEFAHPGLSAAHSVATARIVDLWRESTRC